MSTDKEEFALYCEAKNDKVRKRLGIKGGFYWTTAKKLSVAISRCITAMDDNDYDEDDFKKPVRVNLPVVDDLPPEGVFDTEFCNRYEKGGKDGITMTFIGPSPSVQDKPASTDNTNINGEDMTEIEESMLLPVSGQELPIRWLAQHGSEKPVTHVSRDELQALHIARLKNYRLLLPWLFRIKPVCSTRWRFATSTNWFVTLTKFSLILVIQTWD
ncbi:hypothetical protein L1001_03375 [Escherichia coli]|nr:RecE family exodeoxyribonuclease [Escherichia coli]MCF3221487.1 hypothetical protein [Escherichia coli]